MNKVIQQGAISATMCIVLFLFIFAGFPCLSFGAHAGFKVFRVEFDRAPIRSNHSNHIRDFYINGGEDDGLSVSMVLDVYREKVVYDENSGKDFEINILVGQVKVIRLFKNIAITRIIALTSSDDSPVLQYRTVMIGDYAVPTRNQGGTKKDNKTSKINTMIPGTDKIPLSLRSSSLFPSNVLFEVKDWKLKPEATEVLSHVRDIFNQSKDKDIFVEGHTCSLGTDRYNSELSKKRAQSVSDYLMNRTDIPMDHIHIKYYGEKFPVASNVIEEGRVRNRRVEIRFLPHDTLN
jgi:outer membrane protein OmpA-like peptidoglycan-associated protein